MTLTEIGQILEGCGTFLTAVIAAYGLYIGQRNSRKIDAVHASTNGKMDQLLKLTASSSYIAGGAAEKKNPT